MSQNEIPVTDVEICTSYSHHRIRFLTPPKAFVFPYMMITLIQKKDGKMREAMLGK